MLRENATIPLRVNATSRVNTMSQKLKILTLKLIKEYSVTLGILAKYLLLKSYISKVLEYKGNLNKRIKFVCINELCLFYNLNSFTGA